MQRNYSIQVGGGVYSCLGYEEVTFDVPVPEKYAKPADKKEKARKTVGSLIKLTSTVLDSYMGGASASPGGRMEDAFSVVQVRAVKLNKADGTSVFVFTPKGKSWIQSAMSTGSDAGGVRLGGELNAYMRACHELYANSKSIFESVRDDPGSSRVPYCDHYYLEATRYTRDYAVLYELNRSKGCPRAITDESLDGVAGQFARQDEEWRAEEENEAKREEARRLEKERELEQARQAEKERRKEKQRAKAAAQEESRRKAREKQEEERRVQAAEHEKRLKAEAELRRTRKKQCEEAASEITAAFDREGLLRQASLPTREKLNELKRVRDFCLRYVPGLSERDYRVQDVQAAHPDYVDPAACEAFARNWAKLSAAYFGLLRGVQGEEKVAEVLELYDDRIGILQNYRWGYEHDFIVLAPVGIFTVEVKTLRGNYTLTETGILKEDGGQGDKWYDVALQSKKHVETLRRKLAGCGAFNPGVPLQQIICSAEPAYTIKDEYHLIPVCYKNTIDQLLLPSDGRAEVLSRNDISEIRAYLEANREEERRYALFAPNGEIDSREEFIRGFASIAGVVACARKWPGETS